MFNDLRFFLFFSFLFSVFVPQYANGLERIPIYGIGLVVFISLANEKIGKMPSKKEIGESVQLVFLNFVFLGALLIITSFFMGGEFKKGLILYALFPSAGITIGLIKLYGGNLRIGVIAQIIIYLMAAFITPLLIYLFLKKEVDLNFLEPFLVMFAFPLGLALASQKTGFRIRKERAIINLTIALVFYIILAKSINLLSWEMLVAMLPVFGISLAIPFFIYKNTKNVEKTIFGSLKNGGAAAAAGVLILPPLASLTIAFKIIIDMFVIFFMGFLFKKQQMRK